MKNQTKHLVRRMGLLFSPFIIGIVVAQLICQEIKNQEWEINAANMIEVSKIMIGVWGTLLGFIITAESILVAFGNGTITSDFKKTGHYMTVIFQYTQTSVKLLIYIFVFIGIIVISKFTIKEMFLFIWFGCMTFVDVVVSFGILILMLKMANR